MNYEKELTKQRQKIEQAKKDHEEARENLAALEARRAREAMMRPCPNCKQPLNCGPLPATTDRVPGAQVVNEIECQCGAKIAARIISKGQYPLSPETVQYEFSLNRVGWNFEDKAPRDMTEEELQTVLEGLAALPKDGILPGQRAKLEQCWLEKTRRQR